MSMMRSEPVRQAAVCLGLEGMSHVDRLREALAARYERPVSRAGATRAAVVWMLTALERTTTKNEPEEVGHGQTRTQT